MPNPEQEPSGKSDPDYITRRQMLNDAANIFEGLLWVSMAADALLMADIVIKGEDKICEGKVQQGRLAAKIPECQSFSNKAAAAMCLTFGNFPLFLLIFLAEKEK